MKRTVFILLILSAGLLSYSSDNLIKVISYNIWNGFDWGKDTVRKQKFLHWMKAQNADVAALQELCAYTPEKLAADAKVWGHPYSVLLKTSGYSVGLTSRYPIRVKERLMEHMHHGALHCQTAGMEIFVLHLSPFRWKKRNEEAAVLLKRIKREIENGSKVIVCGDFNALSPMDYHLYKNNQELLESMKKDDLAHSHVKNLREENFCFSTLSKLMGVGLYDVCARYTSTMAERISYPTLVFDNDEEEILKKGIRIDYILTSYNLINTCTDVKIPHSEETSRLSDHYPVVAAFKNEQ